MGGYGSTRWNGIAVRHTTDASLSLDVGAFARYFDGKTWGVGWNWKRGDADAGSIRLLVERERMTLMYTVTRAGYEPETVRDEVAVVRTGCNYGGERAWFICPSCGTRRRVLYLPSGATRFRCRECHKLAYGTQQMDTHDRHLHRIRVLQAKLDGGKGSYAPFRVPPKPTGMRWATYYQIHDQILMHEIARTKILAAQFAVHAARWRASGLLSD